MPYGYEQIGTGRSARFEMTETTELEAAVKRNDPAAVALQRRIVTATRRDIKARLEIVKQIASEETDPLLKGFHKQQMRELRKDIKELKHDPTHALTKIYSRNEFKTAEEYQSGIENRAIQYLFNVDKASEQGVTVNIGKGKVVGLSGSQLRDFAKIYELATGQDFTNLVNDAIAKTSYAKGARSELYRAIEAAFIKAQRIVKEQNRAGKIPSEVLEQMRATAGYEELARSLRGFL